MIAVAENHLPYHQQPLSKEYLRSEAEVNETLIQPADWYRGNKISVRQGTRATAVDVQSKSVTLDNGQTFGYDRLLIATGAEPNRPPISGLGLPGVHLLRTLDDSTAI